MSWKTLAPAFGAGLLSAAVFWWATVLYLCARCNVSPLEQGTACTWDGPCLGWIGGGLAVALVALALLVPFRLVERRWPWQRPGSSRAEE